MIDSLPPYAEYQETGFQWLGKIPAHWEVRRIKTVLQESEARSTGGEGVLLSLTRTRGLIARADMTDKVHSATTLDGYKKYRAGQIVMNRMQAWSGMFGAGRHDGLVSPDYAVFDVLRGQHTSFVLERLKAPDLVAQFALASKGIGSGFNRLYTDRFGPIQLSLPPLEEQAAIVRFLDWANGRLERAIRAKRKVIALLDEQKQAIIHRAVTGGLDGSVPTKPAGVDGVVDLPQHWEVRALKRALRRLIDCEHKTAPHVDQSEFRVARTSAVRRGAIQFQGTYCTTEAAFRAWTRRGLPEPGDVIFTREAPAGEACLVPINMQLCLGQRTVLMKVRKDTLDPQFLIHMIYAGPPRSAISQASQGSTVGHFNVADIGALTIFLPPIAEQRAIVSTVAQQTAGLDIAMRRLGSEIELLSEYRTRLIADVVTGKLDVREAAARLPAEATDASAGEEADPADDAEALDEEAAA